MADLTQLQTWLAEAEAARHLLAMGEQVVEVWRDGRRMTYSERNLSDLNDYISFLGNEIDRKTNEAAGRPRRSGIGVTY
ncbi:head-tail joining protein [Sphingobium sp. HDIP04]|uniref:head-tail joining protein n=1 Tax=Sphingobium sp. HDIP04 TaxID=428994 RepID=UPI00038777F5|nr:head-tail joining protein [Sphingobium sp. HDIP04]EQA97118.1 head-tail joining protein [Sphingobium sp. HDIP04]